MTSSDEPRPSTTRNHGASPTRRSAPSATPSKDPAPARRVLRVRDPEDLLAAVPVALGFVPEASVVMLTLGPGNGPHARVDLDPGGGSEHVDLVAATLLDVVHRHAVERMALVLYGPLASADEVVDRLLAAFAGARVRVAAMVAADGSQWRSWVVAHGAAPHGTAAASGRRHDPRSHRFAAEAVLAGQVVLGSREELVESIMPSPLLAAEVRPHLDTVSGTEPDTVAEVEALVRRLTTHGRPPTPRQTALLRRAVSTPQGRDAVWGWVPREAAGAHVDLWRQVVRSCARGEADAAASVLAFHSWLAGDGALAWCALDRSREGGASTSLGVLVGELLERAVSPRDWVPIPVGGPTRPGGADDAGEPVSAQRGTSGSADRAAVVDLAARRNRQG